MKSVFENYENPSPSRGEVYPPLAAPKATRGKGGGGNPGARWGLVHDLSLLFDEIGYGANNAQKSAAVIFMLLLSAGTAGEGHVPFWAMLGCSASLAGGVPVGGWKIAKILSGKSSKIQSVHSLTSQLAEGVVLTGANLLGGFLSPNQLAKASVLGTGASGRKETPWRVLEKDVIMAWFISTFRPAPSLRRPYTGVPAGPLVWAWEAWRG